MTEDIEKGIEFYRKAVKINGMAIAWDVFDFCDREIILNAIKHPRGVTSLNCRWRNDEKPASRAIQLHTEKIIPNMIVTTLIEIMIETAVRKN